MSDEYVSRQYLLDEYDRQHQGPPGGARKIIAEAPAEDVVQVVRCKDCLFFTTEKSCCRPEGLIKAREDDFCSYGERREE